MLMLIIVLSHCVLHFMGFFTPCEDHSTVCPMYFCGAQSNIQGILFLKHKEISSNNTHLMSLCLWFYRLRKSVICCSFCDRLRATKLLQAASSQNTAEMDDGAHTVTAACPQESFFSLTSHISSSCSVCDNLAPFQVTVTVILVLHSNLLQSPHDVLHVVLFLLCFHIRQLHQLLWIALK